MGNFTDKVKRYFPFNDSEIKAITLTIIFLTFIVAFNDHQEEFRLTYWAANFLIWLLIIVISVFVKQVGHRMLGLHYGFRVEYGIWWYGILIGTAIALVSRGTIWILIPGGITIYHMAAHRLGWFRYGINMKAFSLISLAGPVANITFATFIKSIQIYTPLIPAESMFVNNLFLFNLAFAAYSMLPIPPLDGSRVIYDSRMVYAFSAGCIFFYAILAYLKIYSWIYAVLLGIALWFAYYWMIEEKV